MKEAIVPDNVSSSNTASKQVDATFEIKVAIIGNVSAGKTTVLNALFRDKYGEVSMKRTTAGVNEFIVSSPNLDGSRPKDAAKSILTEITADNVALRASKQVKTKRFEIQVEAPLCEMRKDTQLVVVDIPGINEAHTSKKYKDYVKEHWNTFDCVLVVMDGRQGVNTDEQVSLLRFVKSNLKKSKDVPVMILCNKIDDPDDQEQMEMVLEAQREVEKIFAVQDRQKSLEEVLEESPAPKPSLGRRSKRTKKSQKDLEEVSPVFIPISGITAFVFQSCSSMSLETFRSFDEDLIAKLGRERIGKRKWKRLSKEEQIRQAHQAVSDPEGYKEGIEDSNFDKVLGAFSYLMSGTSVQERMIQKQIQVSLSKIQCQTGLVDHLETSYTQISALSEFTSHQKSVKDLKESFWRLCEKWKNQCFSNQQQSWKASEHFAPIANELKKYHDFASTVGWDDEVNRSVTSFKTIVQQAFKTIKATEGFVDNIMVVFKEMKAFSLEDHTPASVTTMKKCFEKLYQQFEKEKLDSFSGSDAVHHLSPLADELVKYAELAKGENWENEVSEVTKKFKNLVLRQICSICELSSDAWSKSENIYRRRSFSFDNLNHMDWKRIVSSILLLRYEQQFCIDFGREIVWMEHLVNTLPRCCSSEKNDRKCPSCQSVLTFNRFCMSCPAVVRNGNYQGRCFVKRCSGYMYSNRCQRCGVRQVYGGSEKQNPVEYECPDCDDEVLDFNRQCGKCNVFFYRQKDDVPEFSGSCKLVCKELPVLDVETCPRLKYSRGGLVLEDKLLQKCQLVIPASFSDPNHFGHLVWRYCEFMRSQN